MAVPNYSAGATPVAGETTLIPRAYATFQQTEALTGAVQVLETKALRDKGFFLTPAALTTAYPAGVSGDKAVVGTTDTVWVWDADTNAWKNTNLAPPAAPAPLPFVLNGSQFIKNGTVGVMENGAIVQKALLELHPDFIASLKPQPTGYVDLLAAATTGNFAEFPHRIWGPDGQVVWNVMAPANTEVAFICDVPDDISKIVAAVMGFGLTNANTDFNGYDYKVYSSGSGYASTGTGMGGANYDDTVYAGDRMRLLRAKTSGQVTVSISRDKEASWDLLYTYSQTTTAALWLKGHLVIAGNSFFNPRVKITS